MIARLVVPIVVCAAVLSADDSPAMYPLTGTVIDAATRSPLAGAEIQVSPTEKHNLVEATFTDPEGHFAFHNLYEGKYRVTAAHSGYFPASYQQHGRYSTTVMLGTGFLNRAIVMSLEHKCSIGGLISDQNGDPASGAEVIVMRAGILEGFRVVHIAATVRTGEDGQYRALNLQAGLYYIATVAQPWYSLYQHLPGPGSGELSKSQFDTAYPVTFYPSGLSDASASTLNLRSGDHAEANLVLTSVPAVHLTITQLNQLNRAPQLFVATKWGVDIPVKSMYFSPKGRAFSVAPGIYKIAEGRRDGGRGSAATMVAISADIALDPAALDSTQNLTATISSAAAGSAARERQPLLLRDLSTGRTSSGNRGRNGEITWPMQELTSDRYEVVSASNHRSFIAGLTATNAKVSGDVIEISHDASPHLVVRLGEGMASLRGFVKSGQTPVSGQMVLLVPSSLANAPSLVRRDQSDSDGSFHLENIAPGTYTLIAIPPDDDLEYTNPAIIGPYLSHGLKISIAPNGNYTQVLQIPASW